MLSRLLVLILMSFWLAACGGGAGEIITLYDDGDQVVATAIANGSGGWSISASAMPGGTGLDFVGGVTVADPGGRPVWFE